MSRLTKNWGNGDDLADGKHMADMPEPKKSGKVIPFKKTWQKGTSSK